LPINHTGLCLFNCSDEEEQGSLASRLLRPMRRGAQMMKVSSPFPTCRHCVISCRIPTSLAIGSRLSEAAVSAQCTTVGVQRLLAKRDEGADDDDDDDDGGD
jgi:hypothetical protein